eukprot:11202101-Lingulodinium_polyedra.AAC.1
MWRSTPVLPVEGGSTTHCRQGYVGAVAFARLGLRGGFLKDIDRRGNDRCWSLVWNNRGVFVSQMGA